MSDQQNDSDRRAAEALSNQLLTAARAVKTSKELAGMTRNLTTEQRTELLSHVMTLEAIVGAVGEKIDRTPIFIAVEAES